MKLNPQESWFINGNFHSLKWQHEKAVKYFMRAP